MHLTSISNQHTNTRNMETGRLSMYTVMPWEWQPIPQWILFPNIIRLFHFKCRNNKRGTILCIIKYWPISISLHMSEIVTVDVGFYESGLDMGFFIFLNIRMFKNKFGFTQFPYWEKGCRLPSSYFFWSHSWDVQKIGSVAVNRCEGWEAFCPFWKINVQF